MATETINNTVSGTFDINKKVFEIHKGFEFDSIINEDDRIFKCWGSVEIVDRHGEIIPMEEFKKFMHIWTKRGAPIMDNHSNRQIGKGLNFEFLEKDDKKGVLITGMIYRDYPDDDVIWDKIKSGEKEGLSVGGKVYAVPETKTDGSKILRNLAGFEFSVVDRCGNQGATFETVNALAKSDSGMVETPLYTFNQENMTNETKKDEVVTSQTESAAGDLKSMLVELVGRLDKMENRFNEIEDSISGAPENSDNVDKAGKKSDEEEEKKPEEKKPQEEEKKKEESEEEEEKEDEKKPNEEEKKKADNALLEEVRELKKAIGEMKVVAKAERPSEGKLNEDLSNLAIEIAKGEHKDKSFAELGEMVRGQEHSTLKKKLGMQ